MTVADSPSGGALGKDSGKSVANACPIDGESVTCIVGAVVAVVALLAVVAIVLHGAAE